jgi:hypothetical protein
MILNTRYMFLLLICVAFQVVSNAAWITKAHVDKDTGKTGLWDTTDIIADMDNEVLLGAKILKFANGEYVHAPKHQYGSTCGPASFEMVLMQMGYDRPGQPMSLPQDVDMVPGTFMPEVDVGHFGSQEHLMWLGYHRRRLGAGDANWNGDELRFMSTDGMLLTNIVSGQPAWCKYGRGIGTKGESNGYWGLPGIMNYIIAKAWKRGCDDARPKFYYAQDRSAIVFRRTVKGFIDNGISLIVCVESRGHFNALIGYLGDTEDLSKPFYIYTADPLDGWGRPYDRQPLRWRRINAIKSNFLYESGLITALVIWNQHLNGGCLPGGWAYEIDQANMDNTLCGRPNPVQDPLNDPMAKLSVDLWRDGKQNSLDLLHFSSLWNTNETEYSYPADFVDDGFIDAEDLLELIMELRKGED